MSFNISEVIDALDPAGALISHRLYRQHCTDSLLWQDILHDSRYAPNIV